MRQRWAASSETSIRRLSRSARPLCAGEGLPALDGPRILFEDAGRARPFVRQEPPPWPMSCKPPTRPASPEYRRDRLGGAAPGPDRPGRLLPHGRAAGAGGRHLQPFLGDGARPRRPVPWSIPTAWPSPRSPPRACWSATSTATSSTATAGRRRPPSTSMPGCTSSCRGCGPPSTPICRTPRR